MNRLISKSFVLPLVTAVTICVVSSLAHGWLDGRWVDRPNVDAIGAQLKAISELDIFVSIVNDEVVENNFPCVTEI